MALIGEFEAAARAADPAREPDQFKLCGELFTVSEANLTIPMGRFAQASREGAERGTMKALAAMLDLLEGVVIEEDRERFLTTASRNNVDDEVLWDIVGAVMEAVAGRPTQQPAVSSSGLSTTGANSTASSPFGQVPPIQLDPRVQALQPVAEAALSLVG